jgi:uncharacterized protein (DUF1501 family)
MGVTRRDLLKRSAITLPAIYLGPKVFMRAAFGSPAVGPHNVVLVELSGGNDGINTIVPYGVDGGTYYSEFRDTLAIPEANLLKVNSEIGFHPALALLKQHYDAGRLAVVQGCSYPNPNFSHEVASGIYDTGTTGTPYGAGWIARYLALQPLPVFPLALEGSTNIVDGVLAGSGMLVPAIKSVTEFVLPYDSKYSGDKNNRRAAYEAMANGLTSSVEGNTSALAGTMVDIVDLVDVFKTIPAYSPVATFPNNSFGKAMKLVAQMLKANLGTHYFHVSYGGFDTHADQEDQNYHTLRLQTISEGIDALYADLTSLGLMNDTLIVVYTEFGRTVYENGSNGTDHGTIVPILVLGNSVVGGLTTPHPSMDPGNLTSSDQPPMVTDFRNVWGTILNKWLGGSVAQVFPSYGAYSDLGFLG